MIMRMSGTTPRGFFPGVLMAIVLYSCCVSQKPAAQGNERDLKILYTASLNGNMAGCDCASNPRAGLLKRIAWLSGLPDRNESLLLDAGDVMDVYPDIPLTDLIMAAYGRLGYDAVSIGDQDFSNGITKLLEYREKVPLLAGNLALCPDENSCILFPAAGRVLERNGLKISVQSVLGSDAFLLFPGELASSVKLMNAESAVESFLRLAADEKADVTVLMYHGRYETARTMTADLFARTGLHPDIVILGHEQRLIEPEIFSGAVFVSPGPEGNRVGILELSVLPDGVVATGNGFRLFSFSEDPDDPEAAREYARYEEEMRMLLRKK